MNDVRKRFRAMLARPQATVAPFVFDCLQARLAADAGFEAVYMTGFGTAAARGFPDLGLLSMSEMAAAARSIAGAVSLPVIADADTGYGNELNVHRTVREYEDAGVAALHIEDQVFPKRCGFMAGKNVIALDEMVPRVRAASDARRDSDLVIIARTDALAPHGWDEVERRGRAYREAGADLIFADGIKTRDDLTVYARRMGDLPLVYNGDLIPLGELARYPFKLVIHIGTMLAIFAHIRDTMRQLMSGGTLDSGTSSGVFEEFTRIMGVAEWQEIERKYRAPK